jgi:hypothetical protein
MDIKKKIEEELSILFRLKEEAVLKNGWHMRTTIANGIPGFSSSGFEEQSSVQR